MGCEGRAVIPSLFRGRLLGGSSMPGQWAGGQGLWLQEGLSWGSPSPTLDLGEENKKTARLAAARWFVLLGLKYLA